MRRLSERPLLLCALMLLASVSPLFVALPAVASPEDQGTAAPLEVLLLSSGDIDGPAMVGDADGSFHVFWIENGTKVMYAQIGGDGAIANGPAPLGIGGVNQKHSPALAIDGNGDLHAVWIREGSQRCLMFYAFDPYSDPDTSDSVLAFDDSYGTILCRSNIYIDDPANPAVVADYNGNAHVVWQDRHDPLGDRWGLEGIRYAMMEPNWTTGNADSPIFDTLLTPDPSRATHPDIALTAANEVVVTWQDARGSMVELAFILDTSGSMSSGQLCADMYGSSSSPGVKAIASGAGYHVLETIYGLNDIDPNCQGHQTNQRSRTVMLSPADDSGGSRKLHRTIYNGQSQNWGAQHEDWGPGTTWACLSWRDAAGNVGNLSNPPTQHDHRWNPDATKFVFPRSDEGPKGGDPSQQADDLQTINEAHDSCLLGGVVVHPLSTTSWTGVNSHMLDLANCPTGSVSTSPRVCSAQSDRLTDVGGSVFSVGSNSMLSELIDVANSGGPEIFTTVLDPYAKLRDPNHVRGSSAHDESGGVYTEDIGWGGTHGNHFVVVNDTRITEDYAFSTRPQVDLLSNGWFEFVWSDSRNADGSSPSDPYEVYQKRVDITAWDFSGQAGGIDIGSIQGAESSEVVLTPVENGGSAVGSRDADVHSSQPAFVVDNDDLMHVVWVEHDAQSTTNISYRRSVDGKRAQLQHAPNVWWTGCSDGDQFTGCPTPTYEISEWDSEKQGAGNQLKLVDVDEHDGQPPALAVTTDRLRTAAVAWVDNVPCDSSSPVSGEHICLRRIQRSLVILEPVNETGQLVFEPGESKSVDFEIDYRGSASSGDITTHLDWISGMSTNWDISVVVGSGQTANTLSPLDEDFQISPGATPLRVTITAPSKYAASDPENHLPALSILDENDGVLNSIILDITLNVEHGIELATPQDTIEIEQGGSGLFSVNISNSGNIWEEISFPSSTSLEGQALWGLPFGWSVNFVDSVDVLDGQKITKNLQVRVPDYQDEGSVILTLMATSAKAAHPSTSEGSRTTLDLEVIVAIRSSGNIVFELWDTEESVNPGECAEFRIMVNKNYGSGALRFSMPLAPTERPASVSAEDWKKNHWTVSVDFSEAPGGNANGLSALRTWAGGSNHPVTVELCAPELGLAGVKEKVSLRAELNTDSRVNDEVDMTATIRAVWGLEAFSVDEPGQVYPGEIFEVGFNVTNIGNIADTFDPRPGENSQSWDVEVVPGTPSGLLPSASMTMYVRVRAPFAVPAGDHTVQVDLVSTATDEESLRTSVNISVVLLPWVDLALEHEGSKEIWLDTRGYVDITFNVVNNGNWLEAPWLENHTLEENLGLAREPGLAGLGGVQLTWYLVENQGTPVAMFSAIEPAEDGRLMLPELTPGAKIPVVLRVSMDGWPGWGENELGVRLRSGMGYADDGGDRDADTSWLSWGDDDSNDQRFTFRVQVADLSVHTITESFEDGEVSLEIIVRNLGDDDASNIAIRVCGDRTSEQVESSGCSLSQSVADARIAFIPAVSGGRPGEHTLTVSFPSDAALLVTIILDPDDELVESDEQNNIRTLELGLATDGDDLFGEELGQFVMDYGLTTLLVMLWMMIMIIGLTSWRRRSRDRAQHDSGQWSDMGALRTGQPPATAASKKSLKERLGIAGKSPTDDGPPMATIHAIEAPRLGERPSADVDISDLDLRGADDAASTSAPSGAFEPLDTGGHEPSPPKKTDSPSQPEKKGDLDRTIGDLIDDLL